ncbi:BMP family ABC transporter substrate-binding protein [Fervidobacterium riparium]|uniref:Nucleoside-binding protein n=1 Tax=Fervidobacterium gondwanense DSM 13020 TaxID=1121883 RepID=A0A1M7RVM2_FERGO|nr:BMP family ABC transporter substrate-binding protein [Fervidobacterium gondwanense]UXF01949.1 membrane protein [Fervidobacterium riparium]SHN50291.1 nucleoside-binding protein [Fervidobacterium gondwanense DSM 13020]
MKKLLVFALLAVVLTLGFSFKAIMVTDTGGLGDKSFNDGTWAGIERAAKELKVESKVIMSQEQSDYIPNLTKAAEEVMKEKDGGIVFAVGFMMTDALMKVAQQYPTVYFAGIDIAFDKELPNVINFLFKEQESAFLVGYIAAAMTRTGKVGFIGGIAIPPVERFRYGYEAGIKAYTDLKGKKITILRGYTNEFSDPKKGKDLAVSQFSQGADIIFAAAGACGNGVIEAAKERSEKLAGKGLENIKKYALAGKSLYYAIGVDVDQDYMAPGVVLTSAMKGVDMAGYYGVKWAFTGQFKGGVKNLGLKEQGVRMSEMKYTKEIVDKLAPNVLKELDYLKQLIIEGKVVVPDSEDALKAFTVKGVKLPK